MMTPSPPKSAAGELPLPWPELLACVGAGSLFPAFTLVALENAPFAVRLERNEISLYK
jgi:hypothetical protein